MARDETQREDLLREATALIERVAIVSRSVLAGEKCASTETAPIVAGFRANGSFSLFFGEDPVYQFNSVGQLRRAFVDGRLYKAVGGRLIELQRVRQHHQVELRRHELTAHEESGFLSRVVDRVHALQALLDSGNYQIAGQIPPNAHVIDRVQKWMDDHQTIAIAERPNA
jgi:hypothetical protein